jgi:MoaA/NifB/PqqE/SkfB family radical SAM enzyme
MALLNLKIKNWLFNEIFKKKMILLIKLFFKMKQLTIEIPDEKFPFFVELLNNLGIKDMHENELFVPEWHKNIVLERQKSHTSENTVLEKEFDLRMKAKHGL